jgi:hypothetical protein
MREEMRQLMRERESAFFGREAAIEEDEAAALAGEQASAQLPVRVLAKRRPTALTQPGVER